MYFKYCRVGLLMVALTTGAWGQAVFAVDPGDFTPPTPILAGSTVTYVVSGRPNDVWYFEAHQASASAHQIFAEVFDENNNVVLRRDVSFQGLTETFTTTRQARYRINIGPLIARQDVTVHLSFGCTGICPAGPTDIPHTPVTAPRKLSVTTPGSGTVTVAERYHLYRFYSAPPAQVTLVATQQNISSANPDIRLYYPGGTFATSAISSQTATLRYSTTRTGYHYVYVSDRNDITYDLPYSLTIACSPACGPDPQDPTVFVQQLYLDLLGRAGETSGVQFWVNELNTRASTRAQVANNFFNSAEFQDSGGFVISTYIAVLGRDPEFGGWHTGLTW